MANVVLRGAEAEDQFAWRLGSLGKSDKPTMFYCVRRVDLGEVNDFSGRVSDQKAVLFWFGEKLADTYYPEIVSLAVLISASGRTLKVKKALFKPFLDEKFFAKSGDIELDKHIVPHRKGQQYYLLLNKMGNGFEKNVPIRPLWYGIIKAAYGRVKANPYGLKLDAFVYPREIAVNKRTISTGIKNINELCDEQGIPRVLTKDHEHRLGLNRVLGCCR